MTARVNNLACPTCGCTWFTWVSYNRLSGDGYVLTRGLQTLHTHEGSLDLPQCLACGNLALPGVTADQSVKQEYELYCELVKEVNQCRTALGKKELKTVRTVTTAAKMVWNFFPQF